MDYSAKQAIDSLRRDLDRVERRVAELERQAKKDEGGYITPSELRSPRVAGDYHGDNLPPEDLRVK